MKQIALATAVVLAPVASIAETASTVVQDVIQAHIMPRFETLRTASRQLADVAAKDCRPTSATLRASYGDAFDAWVLASHLRFGPTETDDRAYALAFWPDSRGATPRALGGLISGQDPIGASVADYAAVSIAARGFYALEYLLYDDALMVAGEPSYHCQLVQTISADIAVISDAILSDWQQSFAAQMLSPSDDGPYRTNEEVLQELFKALTTGLQFTSDTRLGRPLGTFDRPRPTRAEARRSGRSARHVGLSLQSLQDLTARLASDDAELANTLNDAFEDAQKNLLALNDPTFDGAGDPQSRLRIEVLQQSIDAIRDKVGQDLGPTLGVAAGFNSLDGD